MQLCEKCEGSGWQVVEEGTTSQARRCDCFREQHGEELAAATGAPARYQQCSIRKFNTKDENNAENTYLFRARRIAKDFVDDYPNISGGLLFMGRCGIGKTHLAAAILLSLAREKGVAGLFCDFTELVERIQATFSPEVSQSKAQVLAPVLECELLVLDELGAQKPTEWVRDTLYYLINTRYSAKRVTLFTTNYPDESAEKQESLEDRIGVRLRSRLYEMTKLVEMDGPDYRRTVMQAGYRFSKVSKT